MEKETIAQAGLSEKPAETTVTKTGATAAEPDNTTAAGVHALLMSEFAEPAAKPAIPDATEVPAPEKPAEEQSGTETAESGEQKTEDNGEEGEGLFAEGELPAELQAQVNKRIGKAVRQREELKTEHEATKAKLAETTAALEAARKSPPLQALTAPALGEEQLQTLETGATRFLDDAQAVLDGTATPQEKARVDKFMESNRLDETGLKRTVRDYTKLLATDLPKQREQLKVFRAEEAKVEPVIAEYFPWMNNPNAPEQARVANIKALMPEMAQRTPAHKLALAIYDLGFKEFEKLKAAKAAASAGKPAAAATTKPPPQTPKANSSPASTAPRRSSTEDAARTKFQNAPTRQNVQDLLAASL